MPDYPEIGAHPRSFAAMTNPRLFAFIRGKKKIRVDP
jgi:hypothetical protein